MSHRALLCGFSALVLACWGCNGPGPSRGAGLHKTGGPPAPRPPMTFHLCAEGLPNKGYWKCDPATGDVNGDGWIDLAAHERLGRGPKVWLGNGQGAWTESSEGLSLNTNSCGGGIVLRDVNRDDFPDVVLADHCHGVFVYLGDGAGKWQMVVKSLHPQEIAEGIVEDYMGAEDLDVGDVNGDGTMDIVAIAQDKGGLSLYFGDGSGTRWVREDPPQLPTVGWGNRVQVHDINQDGFLDVIAGMGEGPRVWLGNGKGDWTLASKGLPTPMTKGLFWGTAVGDVNKDGRLDLAVANYVDGPEIFLQQPDGSWAGTPDVFPDMLGGATGVALGDIDLDGNLDMLVSGRLPLDVGFVYGLFVLQGDGKSGWRYLTGTNLPESGLSTAWGVDLQDVNGDGVLDLLFGIGGVVPMDVGGNKQRESAVPIHVQVWCTELSSSNRAVLAKAQTP